MDYLACQQRLTYSDAPTTALDVCGYLGEVGGAELEPDDRATDAASGAVGMIRARCCVPRGLRSLCLCSHSRDSFNTSLCFGRPKVCPESKFWGFFGGFWTIKGAHFHHF